MAKLPAFTCLTLLLTLASLAYSDDCVYVIQLKTGDVPDAGTDATVTLRVYDEHGNGIADPDLWSDGLMGKDHDYFERNNLDMFGFKFGCLGSKVCNIELSHNNGGSKPGWYVSYVQVTTVWPNGCTQTMFPIDQWLALDEYPYSLSVIKNLCSSSRLDFNRPLNHSLLHLPTSA
ncbi:hypothetical protein RND81_04G089000 [Saponaria officinalis]|uniref:PLAT domain-containing protein n=1 Tax=Saponaria officinalis TaxID=3572 RepID=A0AAW1LK19_SAPOF